MAIGDLCVQGNPHAYRAAAAARRVRKPKRRRPVCKVRGAGGSGVHEDVRATVYRVKAGSKTVHTQSLRHVLYVLEGLGSVASYPAVRVRVGSLQASNLVSVRREFGNSVVRVWLAGGRQRTVRLQDLCIHLRMASELGEDLVGARRFRLIKLNRTTSAVVTERDELVRKLGRSRYSGAHELKLATYPELERLWGRVRVLPRVEQRELARSRLCAQARRGWGVSLKTRPVVRVPSNKVFPRALLARAVKRVFNVLGQSRRPQIARLRKRTRCVATRPQRVGDTLCNWRKWSKDEYVPGSEPA